MKHTHTVIPQVLNWLFLGLLIIVVVCPGGDGPSVPPSGGGAAGDAQGRPMTRLWVANNPGAGQMQPGSSMMIPGMQMQGGAGQPGMGQPGMVQPGMGQPGMAQPGMGQPGMAQPGMGQQMVPGPSGQTQGFILVLPQPPPPPATPSTSTAPSPSPPEDELYKLNQGNNGQLSQTIDVIKKKILAMKREVDLKWKANMRNNLPQDCPQVQKLLA